MTEPEYMEPLEEIIYWCEDCRKYHKEVIHIWSDGYRLDDADIDTDPMLTPMESDYEGYASEVIKTGDDYLGQFSSPVKTTERWTVGFTGGILGCRVASVRRHHNKTLNPSDPIPQHVVDFFDLTRRQPWKKPPQWTYREMVFSIDGLEKIAVNGGNLALPPSRIGYHLFLTADIEVERGMTPEEVRQSAINAVRE